MTKNSSALIAKRQRIDQIDAGILSLIHERMKLAADIAAIKTEIGMEIEDLEREHELFSKLTALNAESNVPDEKLLEIWGKIVELSKQVQEGG